MIWLSRFPVLSVFWFLSSEVEAALTTKATPLATPSCNTLRICTAC